MPPPTWLHQWLHRWWERAEAGRGAYAMTRAGKRVLLVDTTPFLAAVRPNVSYALWLDPGSLDAFRTWLDRHPDGVVLAKRMRDEPARAHDLLWREGFEPIGSDGRVRVPRRIWPASAEGSTAKRPGAEHDQEEQRRLYP